jgi:formate hydrogenlyase transcriptional activator
MDFYYRLIIMYSPLHCRLCVSVHGIPLLVAYFVRKFSQRMLTSISKLSKQAMEQLMRYSWPGNIRELRNVIERAVIFTKDILPAPNLATIRSAPVTLAEAEREHILKALEETDWVVGGAHGAAARLGVKHTTVIDKMGGGAFRPGWLTETCEGFGVQA